MCNWVRAKKQRRCDERLYGGVRYLRGMDSLYHISNAPNEGEIRHHMAATWPLLRLGETHTHTHVDAQTAMHEHVGNDKAGMQTVFVTLTPMHILVARFLLRIVNEKLCSPVGSPFPSSKSYSSV